jgi:predicted Zn-dependent peptidase
MKFKTRKGTLKNGLKYIISHDSNIQTVAMLILVRYGAGFDAPGKSGMAHLLEHLMFKGTTKRPFTKQIMTELNSIGADYNAYTSKTFTGYHAKTAHMYLEDSMEILTDFLKNPKFITQKPEEFQEEFEQEKNIVLQELLTIRDQNSRYLDELVEKNIFVSPYNRIFEDDIRDIKSITLDDVIKTYKKYYCSNNIILSIHGNTGVHVEQLVSKYFSDFKRNVRNKLMFEKSKNIEKIKRIDIMKKPNVSKCNIGFIYPNQGRANVKSYYMREIFGLVFADLSSGRLFQNIREKKGLVYSVRSNHYCYDHQGYFSITTNTDPAHLDTVIKELYKEIDDVKSKGITKKEFTIGINNYSAKLLMASEDPMTIAQYNADELFYKQNSKQFLSYFDIIQLIKKFTLKDLNKFIKTMLTQQPIITIIKPK